jgi:LmbE family N-acetylglucosaminyl deacetylase
MPVFRFFTRWQHVAVLSFFLLSSVPSSAQQPDQIQSDHLLKVNLLFVGAHPDDESGVTATFAREVLDHGARAAVVLATRGEGGGNAIGKELGPSLGILREAEIRRSARTYGVDLVYFLDKTDFFYTLSNQAAFDVWNHEDALARLVRLVRLLRPDVMVTMWPGPGTHGMHQAAARLATEAFTAAADVDRFPEQITGEFLRPWQPLKLYYNTNRANAVAIPTSDISPSQFMSYAEIKALALRNFRSQGFDRFASLPPRRTGDESFLLVRTMVIPENYSNSLLVGIDRAVNPSIVLGPPSSEDPLSIRIMPRTDVEEYRQWAREHQVEWAAGLLPTAISIGSGQTDTLLVEITNRQEEPAGGAVTLSLPEVWKMKSMTARYMVPGQSQVWVPFYVTVPVGTAQGSYPVQIASTTGLAVVDSGLIDVLPVMALTPISKRRKVDGLLDDWEGSVSYPISAGNIWSGAVQGGDADCSGLVRAGYDQDFLYVAIEVRDDVVVSNIAPDDIKGHWRSDAVEICIDPSGRSENTLTVFKAGIFPGTTESQLARAARDADGNQGIIEQTAPSMKVASSFSKEGYVIETAIAWADMPGGKAPLAGHTIGLNVILYDGDDMEAGAGANIGKARLAWSYRPSAQALPYYYGRAVIR